MLDKQGRLWSWLLLGCLLLSGCAAPSATLSAGVRDVGLATGHLPTTAARTIRDLYLWHNRLYIAYGDSQTHAGPLDSLYYDLSSNRIVRDKQSALNQDELVIFREINGVLFTPGMAPCAPALSLSQRLRRLFERPLEDQASTTLLTGNVYAQRAPEEPWQTWPVPDTIKVWDVASYGEALYVAATGVTRTSQGSKATFQAYAAILRSWNGGTSWELAYKDDALLQFSELHVYGERLYATAGGIARVYDGQQWRHERLLPENSGIARKYMLFQHLLVLLPDLSWNGPLFLYDGQETHTINLPSAVRDAVVVGDWLYVLTSNSAGKSALWETDDTRCRCPSSFTEVSTFELGSPATALEYAQGRFYIGAEDGHLYQLDDWR